MSPDDRDRPRPDARRRIEAGRPGWPSGTGRLPPSNPGGSAARLYRRFCEQMAAAGRQGLDELEAELTRAAAGTHDPDRNGDPG